MTHDEKVRYVVEQVRSRVSSGRPMALTKKSVSHFVPLPTDRVEELPRIDLGPLNSIIDIDVEQRICEAESGVTFSDLVQATLACGLMPYTVPELKTITVGGAVSGCSLESLSYKYGGFHDSCLQYEVITGTGEVLNCSPDSDPDIFEMIHGSYGTLGIISKLRFKLLPARPFVHMTYLTFNQFEPYWEYVLKCFEAGEDFDYDFIDSIIHGTDRFVVCLGNLVDRAPYTTSYDWLNVFYKSTASKQEDYMTTYQYFFRYDADCHWLTKTVPLLETRPARLLLGKLVLGSTNLITWSKRLRRVLGLKRRPEVVVDVFIPTNRFADFYRWYETEFDFFPAWIVPYRAPRSYPWLSDEHQERINDDCFIDLAVYGKVNDHPDIDYSELLERKVLEHNGIKTLISRNHYDPETFWQIYSQPRYDSVKERTDPNNLFGNVYDVMHSR